MRYDKESLELALDYLSPEIKKAKSLGYRFSLPELCETVAARRFLARVSRIKSNQTNVRCNQSMCDIVLADALDSLINSGQFDFGDRSLAEELDKE